MPNLDSKLTRSEFPTLWMLNFRVTSEDRLLPEPFTLTRLARRPLFVHGSIDCTMSLTDFSVFISPKSTQNKGPRNLLQK